MDLLPFIPEESEEEMFKPNFTNFSPFSISPAMAIIPPDPYKDLFAGFSPLLLYFASICCVIFMLVGIPGNLFTIVALSRCKKVRNATAVFIINLSCSDLLFCCFNLPLAASTFYYREWVHGELMCRLFPLLRYGLLAVSLFTILTITINRYIMISHPRIYPRIYRRRWLTLMVSLTWLCAFATLIPTWRGKWGKFGMDTTIDSCSILPVEGKSPKQFLFVMAFILPCFAIVLCYARIFYIVRKTAMKTHEAPRLNGSIKMNHNNMIRKTPSPLTQKASSNHQQQRKLSNETNDSLDKGNGRASDEKRRKHLSKMKSDELKFIDTSCESDLPPTLSQLKRKSVQISIENVPIALSSPSSTSPLTPTTIISLENEHMHQQQQLNLINKERKGRESDASLNVGTNVQAATGVTMKNSHDRDMGVDSAVDEEDSAVSLEQNNGAHNLLSVPEPSTSSSGIEMPFDQESPKKKSKKPTKSANAKVKQKKIKEESPPKDITRKKSLVNTSGASILYGAARMSTKDRRLLKMILVIFISFLTCYLPITLTKIMSSIANINFVFITSYLLIYLTTCINPIIYVVMSSEYRQAYKQLLTCHFNKASNRNGCNGNAKYRDTRKKT